jgi:hypothetical protein
MFFTQNNHIGLINNIEITALRIGGGSNPVVTIRGYIHDLSSGVITQVFKRRIDTEVTNYLSSTGFKFPKKIPENSIFYMTAQSTAASTNVDFEYNIVEERIL